jgi:translocation and assembly module TamB
MSDQNGQSPADQPGPSEDRGNGASENGTPSPKPRRGGWRRLAKWLGGFVLVVVLCFALGVAMILYAVNSERGTR